MIESKEKSIIKDKRFVNNLLIEGDNLKALKELRKDYTNKIKLIYIDPPYNTKNKKFIYNDRFESSDWISFMEERLLLSKELLHEEGLIFISIDDNELYNLKPLCDKIFGINNFIENFIWVKNSTKNNSKTSSNNHEYILCYGKNIKKIKDKEYFRTRKPGYDEVISLVDEGKKLKKTPKEIEKDLKLLFKENKHWKGISSYKFIDEKYRVYSSGDLSSPQEGYVYNVIHPITKKKCKVPTNNWRYKEEQLQNLIKEDKILFGKSERTVPRYKRFLTDVEEEVLKSVIINNDDGKKELEKLFNGKSPFNNPKPTSLIKTLISCIPDKDIVVLDFFAGSGTTGHATINLNKMDNGERKFILCNNNENNICEEITYERIKKVLDSSNLIYYKV